MLGYSFRRVNLIRSTNAYLRSFAVRNQREPYFITTPIYYVNGPPHIGHAYTSVIADVVARFKRNDGYDVLFATGTDEHGQKVQQSAALSDMEPQIYADNVADKFKHLVSLLNCSNDDFIRTTEERHKRAVLELWRRLDEKGEIYKGVYEGWYSVTDEAFYDEKELIGGKAPTGADVKWVQEESYFFRLSKWKEKLLQLYKSNPDFILPHSRRNEVLSFLNQPGGLVDLSISRTSFSWGIPVQNDPKHVTYVWLDALVNYLTVLNFTSSDSFSNICGKSKEKYWPASMHIVGKDILRFHAVYWPAFLMAAGLPPPKVY